MRKHFNYCTSRSLLKERMGYAGPYEVRKSRYRRYLKVNPQFLSKNHGFISENFAKRAEVIVVEKRSAQEGLHLRTARELHLRELEIGMIQNTKEQLIRERPRSHSGFITCFWTVVWRSSASPFLPYRKSAAAILAP
jgi:hypothetical protein